MTSGIRQGRRRPGCWRTTSTQGDPDTADRQSQRVPARCARNGPSSVDPPPPIRRLCNAAARTAFIFSVIACRSSVPWSSSALCLGITGSHSWWCCHARTARFSNARPCVRRTGRGGIARPRQPERGPAPGLPGQLGMGPDTASSAARKAALPVQHDTGVSPANGWMTTCDSCRAATGSPSWRPSRRFARTASRSNWCTA